VCACFGYDKGEWVGAITAASVGMGTALLVFRAIPLLFKFILTGLLLFMIISAIDGRISWLQQLFS
jgi:hypothetical protein